MLNYTFDSKGFELKVLTSDNSLIINLLKKATERTANVNCAVKEHVSNHKNEFNRFSLKFLGFLFLNERLHPVISSFFRVYLNLNDLYESLEKEFEILLKNDKQTTTSASSSLLSEPKKGP
jgi:hypothetical protein